MLITPLTQRSDRRTRVTETVPCVEDRKAEVQRVLLSPHFRRTPKLQRFLELICDYYFQNRAHEINEFLIATEACSGSNSRKSVPGTDLRLLLPEQGSRN